MPHVSSKTAIVTSPISVGSIVNFTPFPLIVCTLCEYLQRQTLLLGCHRQLWSCVIKKPSEYNRFEVILKVPVNVIPFIYTAVLGIILVSIIPKADIRRFSFYGILFGGMLDVVFVSIANLLGEFKYINYEPFGLIGIHVVAPTAWSIFFIMYFYFLPNKKVYIYLYTLAGIGYSVFFCQTITKLGVLTLAHGIVSSIIPFVLWFPIATWGFLKLTNTKYLNDH